MSLNDEVKERPPLHERNVIFDIIKNYKPPKDVRRKAAYVEPAPFVLHSPVKDTPVEALVDWFYLLLMVFCGIWCLYLIFG